MATTQTAQQEQPLVATEPTVTREPGDEPQEKKYAELANPFGIHSDLLAGIHLSERRNPYQSEIKFDEKPTPEALEPIKKAGFHWDKEGQLWKKPIEFKTKHQDRVEAERAFSDSAKVIREQRGIEHDVGGPGF